MRHTRRRTVRNCGPSPLHNHLAMKLCICRSRHCSTRDAGSDVQNVRGSRRAEGRCEQLLRCLQRISLWLLSANHRDGKQSAPFRSAADFPSRIPATSTMSRYCSQCQPAGTPSWSATDSSTARHAACDVALRFSCASRCCAQVRYGTAAFARNASSAPGCGSGALTCCSVG